MAASTAIRPGDSVVNLGRIWRLRAFTLGHRSADDAVTLRLRALFDDRKTRTVSYPRMITLDNREVSFRSVINQPVLSSSASASLGAGATSTNSIEYIPIGTVINILPKRMSDGQVLLNISITVSDIVGTELINGNPFPIASSRVYSAPVTVESGYTVAINGLDSANSEFSETGVPLLGRIPILGLAFNAKEERRHKQHLMMLITPTLLDTRGPGVPDRPTIRNPWDNQPMAESRPVAAAAMPASPATNSIAQAEVRTGIDAGAEDVDPLLLASAVPAEPKKRFRLFGKKDDKEAEGDNAEVTPVAVASAEKPATLVDAAEKAFSGNQQTTWTSVAEAGGNKPAESLKNEKPDATPAAPAAAATTVAAASPAPAPMPVKKAAAPASAPAAPAKGIDWKGDQLAGGAEAVPGAVAYLQQELEKATTSGGKDADKVFAQSDRLLRYINDLRDSGQVPVEGQLSDEWWSLLTVKTKAQGLKATATGGPQPALVNNVKPEDQ
ncbi:MAG: type II and III secretion system protein [Akkermansiaceae bacterium]|nr:type II and III secretion system protein [Akkermansiaceae bacterium]